MPTIAERVGALERQVRSLTAKSEAADDTATRILVAVRATQVTLEEHAKNTASAIHGLHADLRDLRAEMHKGFQDVLAAIQALK